MQNTTKIKDIVKNNAIIKSEKVQTEIVPDNTLNNFANKCNKDNFEQFITASEKYCQLAIKSNLIVSGQVHYIVNAIIQHYKEKKEVISSKNIIYNYHQKYFKNMLLNSRMLFNYYKAGTYAILCSTHNINLSITLLSSLDSEIQRQHFNEKDIIEVLKYIEKNKYGNDNELKAYIDNKKVILIEGKEIPEVKESGKFSSEDKATQRKKLKDTVVKLKQNIKRLEHGTIPKKYTSIQKIAVTINNLKKQSISVIEILQFLNSEKYHVAKSKEEKDRYFDAVIQKITDNLPK